MNAGDRAILIDGPQYNSSLTYLAACGISPHRGKEAVLLGLQPEGSKPGWLKGQEVWTVRIQNSNLNLWVPAACLMPIMGATQTETKNIESKNMIFAVTIATTPTPLAQQAGATEEILVPTEEVVANDTVSAAVIVAAENAEKILGLEKEKGKIRVVVRQIG